MVRTDESIKNDVIEKLICDESVDASRISVQVRNGTVTLQGEVPTDFAQFAANYDAWEIAGVTHVNDLLSVNYRPAASLPGNEEIETDIRAKLASMFR